MTIRLSRFLKTFFYLPVFILCLTGVQSSALTRWSSLHFIPDADLLEGGQFILDCEGYYYTDSAGSPVFVPSGGGALGVTEWINVSAAYTGGASLGLKARILGETNPFLPSLSIGVYNIFSHREAYFYGEKNDGTFANELYFALGKNIDVLKVRIDAGLQSIPTVATDKVNPFFGVEKYFGKGVYVGFEAWRRAEMFRMSLFSTWRFWNKHIEVSAGVVDIQGLFTGSDGNSGFSLTADSSFVKPGIWMGIRFSGNIGFGKNEGMQGLETRITRQQETINLLEQELDTVKEMLNISSKKYAAMNRNQSGSSDGQMDEANRLKNLIFDKLVSLKTLYSQEPYEPEQVKTALREVASYQNRALSPLGDIALDKAQDRQIRLIAVSILGELRSSGASDILLSALSKTEDPDMKIETLIALGKTKETRAGYLIRQLTNDPNDAVAFTASEVLQKLEKETGVNFGTKGSANEAVQPYMKEKKIGTDGVSPLREKSKGEKKPTIEKVIPDSAASNAGAAFTETTLLPDSVSGPQNDSTIVKVDSTALKTGVSAPAQKDTSAGPVTTAPSPAQKSAPTKKAAPVKKKRAVEKEDGTW